MVISPVVRRMVAFASAAAKVTVPPGAVQLTIERKLPAPLSLLVVTEPHGLCGATAAGAARTGLALKPGVRTNAAIITSGNATRRRMGQLLPASMTAADGRVDYVANRKKKKEKKIKGEVYTVTLGGTSMTDQSDPAGGIIAQDRAAFTPGIEPYNLGPDSLPRPGIPRGT